MTPVQQFEVWRTELTIELDVLNNEIAAARAARAAAEAVHAQARTEWHALNEFLAGAHRSASEGTAGPLRSRVLNSREALASAERARGAAIANFDSLTDRAADFQLAIDQIDRALTAAKITELPRRAAAPSRRKPQIIDYDDVEMRGAAP